MQNQRISFRFENVLNIYIAYTEYLRESKQKDSLLIKKNPIKSDDKSKRRDVQMICFCSNANFTKPHTLFILDVDVINEKG